MYALTGIFYVNVYAKKRDKDIWADVIILCIWMIPIRGELT